MEGETCSHTFIAARNSAASVFAIAPIS